MRSGIPLVLLALLLAPSVRAAERADRSTGDSANLVLDGRWAKGPCIAVEAIGNLAYFGDGAILRIVEFLDPDPPAELGSVLLPGPIMAVDVEGDHAYVATWDDGLLVVDVDDPADPQIVGQFDTAFFSYDVAVTGTTAILADGAGDARFLDVGDPTQPNQLTIFNWTGTIEAVAAFGERAAIGGDAGDIILLNIANPAAPIPLLVHETGYPVYGLDANGTHVAVAHDEFIQIFDFTDPGAPFWAESVRIGPQRRAFDVELAPAHLYVAEFVLATSSGLVEIFAWDPPSNQLTALTTLVPQGLCEAVAVAGDRLCVGDDDEGLMLVDVTDPGQPVEVARCEAAGRSAGVATRENLIYIADSGRGLQIIDRDLDPPARIGHVETAGFPQRVALSGDHAYLAAASGGLRIIDVADPSAPFEAGAYAAGNVQDVAIEGDVAICAANNAGLVLVDVSDPANPQPMSTLVPASGWVLRVDTTPTRAYLAKSSQGISVVDISNPYSPVELGAGDFLNFQAKAWDVAIAGDYLYVADEYGGHVTVFDVSDPALPDEANNIDVPGSVRGVSVHDGVVYAAAHWAGVYMFDIGADPVFPPQLGFFDTGHSAVSVAADPRTVAVADMDDGVWFLDNGFATAAPGGLPDPAAGRLALRGAWPNPFNPRASIRFALAEAGQALLAVHDAQGRRVATLHDGRLPAGEHEATWDGCDEAGRPVGSGLYLARLESGGERRSAKLSLLR